jgi:hypothetical protein
MPSLIAALDATPLTAAHRQGHQEHHEHNGYRNHDHDDSSRYGCNWDQQGIAHFVSSKSSGRKATRRGAPRTDGEPTARVADMGNRQRPIRLRS